MAEAKARVGSAPKERQNFVEQLKQKEIAAKRRRELWLALNSYIGRHGRWLVSHGGRKRFVTVGVGAFF